MAGVIVETARPGRADDRPRRSDPDGRPHDLVVVAHRGPVRFARDEGRRVVERNGGGLVTALRDIARHVPHTRFLCAATTDEDRVVATEGWTPFEFAGAPCEVRMLDVDPAAHHEFYAVVANPWLWFVQHSLQPGSGSARFGRHELHAWEHGYVAVNREFARALSAADALAPGGVAMIHDYHFYLVPAMVRRARPDAFLHFFVHIPWPEPHAWTVLPHAVRASIFRGLLGSDIIGFHTESYAQNFLRGCAALLGLEVDLSAGSVRVGDREISVRRYPISVDAASLHDLAGDAKTRSCERELLQPESRRVILRVDRADPAKNVVRGFHAYDLMLRRHPQLAERVTFVALLQPTRLDVPEYAGYLAEIETTVAAVNRRHGRPGWSPIEYRLGDNVALAVAAYKSFDVLMVNSVNDGMNLVSKEALVVNENDGVLVLSETTGAHEELGAISVSVQPLDVEQQADALYEALTMPRAERRRRRLLGAEIVATNDLQKWLRHQLFDIELARARLAVSARSGAPTPPLRSRMHV